MTADLLFLLAALHGLIALVTTTANLYVTHRRVASGLDRDATGLRAALAAELANLVDLHKSNLDAIYAGRDALASSRMFSVIYRANLGRLQALPTEAIPALVTAYALAERAEALLAVHAKPHGAVAFSLGKERPFADGLIALCEQAAASAERARRALAPEAEPTAVAAAPIARLAAA